MNTSLAPRWIAKFALVLLAFASTYQMVHGAGVVANCTEADLRAALVGGGTVTFDCEGTNTLTNTVAITNATTLDAAGKNVVLSGGNAVRLFDITADGALTLINVTIANGSNRGINGADGLMGTDGMGGAVLVNGGTLSLIDCRVWTNSVVGGAGGNGSPEGYGGRLSAGLFT